MRNEAIINGIVRFMNANMFPVMTDWQELIARNVVGRAVKHADKLCEVIGENAFIRTLGYTDSEGNIDIEGILADLREQIAVKGKLVLKLKLMPTYTFTPTDVDELLRMIREG